MFETLDNFLSSIGLQNLNTKPGIYVLYGARINNYTRKAVVAWVDDMRLLVDNDRNIERPLHQRFWTKTLGDIHYFIRMKIERSTSGSRSLYINQTVYIHKIQERFRIENFGLMASRMKKQTLRKRCPDKPAAYHLWFNKAIESLQYTAAMSSPDNSYATGIVARYGKILTLVY